MLNPIVIHVNRKFHISLDSIVKIVQKKHGSVYVYFNDGKAKRPKIAVSKQEMSNLLMIINNARIMRGQKALLGTIEK